MTCITQRQSCSWNRNSTQKFKFFIKFEWFNNIFFNISIPYYHIACLCCILLSTPTYALDKIHLLTHPSIPLNVTRYSIGKITLEKSVLFCILVHGNISFTERRLPTFLERFQFVKYSTHYDIPDFFSSRLCKGVSTGPK